MRGHQLTTAKMGGLILASKIGLILESASVLPPATNEILGHSRAQLKQLIAKNIEAEKPKLPVHDLASMVMTFFAGLSVEQNLKSSRATIGRKVDNLMQMLRSL